MTVKKKCSKYCLSTPAHFNLFKKQSRLAAFDVMASMLLKWNSLRLQLAYGDSSRSESYIFSMHTSFCRLRCILIANFVSVLFLLRYFIIHVAYIAYASLFRADRRAILWRRDAFLTFKARKASVYISRPRSIAYGYRLCLMVVFFTGKTCTSS